MTKTDDLSRETKLCRRNDLTLRLESDGGVVISFDGRQIVATDHALSILEAFATPQSIEDVVAAMSSRSAHDFAALTRTILELRAEGVLAEPNARLSEGIGWASSSSHARMLGDFTRTNAFLRAIRESVRPDDVVVDIGTGTGVLAIAAAQAGARKVYAIEGSAIGGVAERMFSANGVSDRIELVRGFSTRVTLPEPATLMISETVGQDALGEGIVETVLDARQRHLAPGARLIPKRMRIFGIPCSLPPSMRREHLFTRENTDAWQNEYGICFDPLRDAPRAPFALTIHPDEAGYWFRLAEPLLLLDLDVATMKPVFERSTTFRATIEGNFDGVIVYFSLSLTDSVEFDTHPDVVQDHHSWSHVAWVNDRPRYMLPGDEASLTYRYTFGYGRVRFN